MTQLFDLSHSALISCEVAPKPHFRLRCSALFVWMCDCDRAAVTKSLCTVSTGRVPLKEIACLQEDRIKSAQIIKSWYFTTPAGGCDLAVGCGSLSDIWKSFLPTCCRRWKERQELLYFRCLSNEITGLACSLSKTLGQCYKTWFVVLIYKFYLYIESDVLLHEYISLKSVIYLFIFILSGSGRSTPWHRHM